MSDEEFDMKWEYVVLEEALRDRKENIEELVKRLQEHQQSGAKLERTSRNIHSVR